MKKDVGEHNLVVRDKNPINYKVNNSHNVFLHEKVIIRRKGRNRGEKR